MFARNPLRAHHRSLLKFNDTDGKRKIEVGRATGRPLQTGIPGGDIFNTSGQWGLSQRLDRRRFLRRQRARLSGNPVSRVALASGPKGAEGVRRSGL